MSLDTLSTLWKVGGIPLVMIACCFLLLRFVGGRMIKAFDHMGARVETHTTQITTSHMDAMRELANSVTQSTAANVQAITLLTDRVSRMEGVVAGLGIAALGESRAAAEWQDEGPTPIERPYPIIPMRHDKSAPVPRVAIPPTRPTTYHQRPATEPGKQKK